MMHDANLVSSSNCYTRAWQRAVGVLHLSWDLKNFFWGMVTNAAKGQYENEQEGGMLLQQLWLEKYFFPCLPCFLLCCQITVLIPKCKLGRDGNVEQVCFTVYLRELGEWGRLEEEQPTALASVLQSCWRFWAIYQLIRITFLKSSVTVLEGY